MITGLMARSKRALGLLVAAGMLVAALGIADAQEQPPFRLYGSGDIGDEVQVISNEGELLGTTTVSSAGVWYLDIQCDSDEIKQLSFSVNEGPADAEIRPTGQLQAQVMLKPMVGINAANSNLLGDEDGENSDRLSEDEEGLLTGDNPRDEHEEDEGDLEGDDEMGDDDNMGEDDGDMAMNEGDDDMAMAAPSTGTGGLADASRSGSSAGLFGIVTALAVAALMAGGLVVARRRA